MDLDSRFGYVKRGFEIFLLLKERFKILPSEFPIFFCLDKIRNILENIGKCNQAIKLDAEISRSVVETIVDKTSFIITEDSLLNLAASDMVDSIFYSNILKFDNEGSSIYINRFFWLWCIYMLQSGSLYFLNQGED